MQSDLEGFNAIVKREEKEENMRFLNVCKWKQSKEKELKDKEWEINGYKSLLSWEGLKIYEEKKGKIENENLKGSKSSKTKKKEGGIGEVKDILSLYN